MFKPSFRTWNVEPRFQLRCKMIQSLLWRSRWLSGTNSWKQAFLRSVLRENRKHYHRLKVGRVECIDQERKVSRPQKFVEEKLVSSAKPSQALLKFPTVLELSTLSVLKCVAKLNIRYSFPFLELEVGKGECITMKLVLEHRCRAIVLTILFASWST